MSSESNPKSEQEMLIQHEPKELAKLFFMGGGERSGTAVVNQQPKHLLFHLLTRGYFTGRAGDLKRLESGSRFRNQECIKRCSGPERKPPTTSTPLSLHTNPLAFEGK